MKNAHAISLFSGCLGFDLGMEMAGIKIIAYAEKDAICRNTILANRPDAHIFNDVFSNDLVSFAKKHSPDIVFGGPPCQSFSTIGKRKFLEDDRGKAVLGFVKVVEACLPRIFVFENVQGFLSADSGSIVETLQKTFRSLGYQTKHGILNAVDFLVPQNRKRFVMIGKLESDFSMPNRQSNKTITLRQSIEELENLDGECISFPFSIGKVMSKIPEGGCWKSLPANEQKKVMGNANLNSGGLTAFYRRLSYDKPSPTLLTSPVQRATTLCHPKKHRPLSIAEYMRIQCFPDNWRMCGTTRDKYRQLGNAVPVLLAKAIGESILS